MALSLFESQQVFAQLVARLLDKARELGYLATLGDAYRDPRVFGPMGVNKGYGAAYSAHKQRLAIDLNLFDIHGTFLSDTKDHDRLGTWWEQQHPQARWGGRFNDGNHYSFEFNDVK